MAYALYVNNGGTPELVDLSQSAAGAVSIVRLTTTLPADIAAGEAVAVPSHVVGSQKLQVFVDGVLCEEGSAGQYLDKTETTVTMNDAYPAGTVIAGVVVQNAVDPGTDVEALITAANAVSAEQTAHQQDIDAAYKKLGGKR